MTTHTPYRCANSAMVQRSTHEVVLMDTGNYPSFNDFLNETWTWNGTDWTNTAATLIDANGPLPGRTQMMMTYDGTNVMLFGGRGASSTAGIFEDTWTWNGTAWTKQAPATVPFGRFGAKASYLSGTGAVMFGGCGGSGSGVLLNETWVWNGTTWTQQTPAAVPAARTGHAMAADTTGVLLFGGSISSGECKNDLWFYTGGNWNQLGVANGPSVRTGASMAWDSTHSVWVLFGGMNEYNYLPETWTFNGTTWTQQAPATSPSGRVGAQMCWDSQSGTVLMFGGIEAASNYPSNATWSWNGTTWAKL